MDTTNTMPAFDRNDFKPERIDHHSRDRLFAAYMVIDPDLTFAAEECAAHAAADDRACAILAELRAIAAVLDDAAYVQRHNLIPQLRGLVEELSGPLTDMSNLASDRAVAGLCVGLHAGAVLGPLVAPPSAN